MRRNTLLLAAVFPPLGLALLNQWYLPLAFAKGLTWGWFADVVQFVVVPVVCWWTLLRPAGVTAADLGLGWRRERHGVSRDDAMTVGLSAALLLAATYSVGRLIEALTWHLADPSVWRGALPTAFAARLLVAIYMSAAAALVEEVVFRALPWLYVGRHLQPGWRRAAYLVATSAVFGLCHSEQGIGGVLSSFWFGLLAARVYLRRGTLWPCVLAHFAYDMLVFGP